ncbi:MAG TPA: SRPBCC domain-containing protein [Solirubrobacteraceae bacterium]
MSEPAPAGDRDYGQLERHGDRLVLRFTRRLEHPRQTVWRALTEPEHLTAWFPTTIEGERAAGAPLHFRHRDGEAPPMDGQMIAFDPPALMELSWGEDVLRLELEPDGEDACVLVLTDTFQELGKAARDAAGWHACLDLLACGLGGETPPWSSAQRWGQIKDSYIERLGPEASSVGPPADWERIHKSGGD